MNPKPLRVTVAMLVAIYASALIVNYVWEMAQMPFYEDMRFSDPKTWGRCFVAAVGDANIILSIFLLGALIFGGTQWPRRLNTARALFLFVAGATVAVGIERFAIATDRWDYSDLMPEIFGVGIVPFLQLLVLPYLTFKIVFTLQSRLFGDTPSR